MRVVPFGTGSYPSSGSGIIYLGDAVSRLDSVQLDADTSSDYVTAQPQLARYRAVLDRLETTALTPEKSRDLIHNEKLRAFILGVKAGEFDHFAVEQSPRG